jgi:hypothetical protein
LVANSLVNFALNDDRLTKKLKGYVKATDKKKQKPLKIFLRKLFKVEDCPEFDSFYKEYLKRTAKYNI